MHTTNITLEKGLPTTLTVVMSVEEAAAISKTFGQMSPAGFAERFPSLDRGTGGEIYSCLVGEVFNRFWEDGVDGFLNGDEE